MINRQDVVETLSLILDTSDMYLYILNMLSVRIDKLWLAFCTLRNIANNSHDAECTLPTYYDIEHFATDKYLPKYIAIDVERRNRGGKASKLAECCLLLGVALGRVSEQKFKRGFSVYYMD